MPNYSKEQINDLVYWLDMNREEIEKQKDFSKQFGGIQKSFFTALQAVQKKIWYVVLLGIAAAALGITL